MRSTPATLASLFHVAFIFAHQISHATHAVVEVNPRHVAFYTRVLGFTPHGAPQSNPRVKAPGVLLVADFHHIGRQLLARDAHGSRDTGEPPPFFSHSFSNAEAQGIRHRIQAALQQAGASLDDVVRVNYVLPDGADFEACWPVLRKHLGTARPAAMMITAGLIDPRMKIEIEVTALKQR